MVGNKEGISEETALTLVSLTLELDGKHQSKIDLLYKGLLMVL